MQETTARTCGKDRTFRFRSRQERVETEFFVHRNTTGFARSVMPGYDERAAVWKMSKAIVCIDDIAIHCTRHPLGFATGGGEDVSSGSKGRAQSVELKGEWM